MIRKEVLIISDKYELNKLDEILSHVKSLDAQMAWVIRSQAPELKGLLMKYFSKRRRAAKVYLAINGRRSSGEIAEYLDILVQNVSNEISELESKGLVELKKWAVYKKSKIDSILGLSRELRKDSEFKDIK